MSQSRFDDTSRALSAPMSRRRALGVILGAVTAGSLLRPRGAAAAGCPSCPSAGNAKATLKCTAAPLPNGLCPAQVCVEPDAPCCSSTTCAGACKPWQTCRDAGAPTATCDDTAKLCSDPRVARPGLTTFCSVEVVHDDFFCSKAGPRTAGWCCGEGATCGDELGDCRCDGERCGDACCGDGRECRDASLGLCCPKRWTLCQARPGAPGKCCPPGDACWYPDKTTRVPECCNAPIQKLDKKGVCRCEKGKKCGKYCCGKGKRCCHGKRCCSADETCLPDGTCSQDLTPLKPKRR